MNCRHVKRMIPEFIEKELTDRQAEGIRNHLSSCRHCKAELESYQELYDHLSTDFSEEKSPFFWARFDRELHQRLAEPTEEVTRGRGYVLARGLAVAAAVAVFFVIGLISQQGGRVSLFGDDDNGALRTAATETRSLSTAAGFGDSSDAGELISEEAREAARTRLANMEGNADTVVVPARTYDATNLRVVTDRSYAGVTPAHRAFERRVSRK